MTQLPPDLEEDRRRYTLPVEKSAIEKHIQTIMVAIVLILLTWVGYSLTTLTEGFIRLDVKFNNLEGAVKELKGELKASISDRYTANDAREDANITESKLKALSSRIDRWEHRLEKNGAGK